MLFILKFLLYPIFYLYNICKCKKSNTNPIFNKNNCICCKNNKKSDDFLLMLIQHIDIFINNDTFNDMNHLNILFQNLIKHCTKKGSQTLSHKQIMHEYKTQLLNDTIQPNMYLEKLVFEQSNGEVCVACPSKADFSCPFDCIFCFKSLENGKDVAKSYTPDQPAFKHLIENDNNFIKYMLQHMLDQHNSGHNMTKIAARHLGGTFHSYGTIYLYEYSIHIFYCVNILFNIINDNELYSVALKSLKNKFDPDNIIMPSLRKPFNSTVYEPILERLNKRISFLNDIKKGEIEAIEKQLSCLIASKLTDDITLTKIDKCKMEVRKIENGIMNDKTVKTLEKELLPELKKSLKMEQDFNVTAKSRIVSYSIETRPDQISQRSIEELLQLGVTIVELGLQSTNDEVLRINKRGHNSEKSKIAIRMLKDNGLHVHGQWMLGLPGSTKEIDRECIEKRLSNDYRCDQNKFYPHLSMPGTLSKELFDTKVYNDWIQEDWDGFLELSTYYASNLDETSRFVRIQRDLPRESLKTPNGYTNNQPSNLETILTDKIYKEGKTREDIRFHEPKSRFANKDDIKYYVTITPRYGGTDIFIAAESYICADIKKGTKDFRIMWGDSRVSIPTIDESTRQIAIFENSSYKYGRIRELKVNGSTTSVGIPGRSVQHMGIGMNLLMIAEDMALQFGMDHVTVTSAVGVRSYYENKHGYILDESNLMHKELHKNHRGKLTLFNEKLNKYLYTFV